MGLLLLDDVLFEAHYGPAGHPERPERLRACRRAIEAASDVDWDRIPARAATTEDLLMVHEPAFVETLVHSVGRSGSFDGDTYFNERSVEVARTAAGGVLALVEALWQRGGRGIALPRPPGHHARPGGAMGFCLINHAALAARRALALGARRVAVVDWDVHHGNGTEEAFYGDPRVLYVSVHQHPLYPGTGAATDVGVGDGRGFTVNVPLSAGATGAIYAEVFRRIVEPIVAEFAPDLLLVSAGYDAHARDPLGGMLLDESTFAAMTRSLLRATGGAPTAVLLEGGYDLDALQSSVGATGRALLEREDSAAIMWGMSPGASRVTPHHLSEVDRARHLHAKFWPSL